MLDNFHITSPWSDGRSLIAKWSWSYDADLHYFEKAYIFYYSRLDEGFERTEVITHPITSFTIQNLRPETTYFVCLRVHHRLQSTQNAPITSTTATLTTATSQSPVTWHVRQPSNPVFSDNYAYEVRCSKATTQNWHLSALIGGVLGVVFALMLGFLLLLVLKRSHCLPSNSGTFRKETTQGSFHGDYKSGGSVRRGGRRSGSKRGSLHSMLWSNRSSNRRSEFIGHLREEDEDEEDDDEEAIGEDDEDDTEIDMGCKSSVRSQVGIYGGSGGTTASSNRHSSVSSSIDAREDSSSVAMPHLPTNGGQTRRTSRQSRDMSRSSVGYESMKNVLGVNVNIIASTSDVEKVRNDMQTTSLSITTNRTANKERRLENSVLTSPISQHLPDPLKGSIIVSLQSPLVRSPSPPMKLSQVNVVEIDGGGECQSPMPLAEPQPVELQTPILISADYNDSCGWIESPKVEASLNYCAFIPRMLVDDDDNAAFEDPEYESSLSPTNATSGSSRSSNPTTNYSYEECRVFLPSDGFADHRHQKVPSIYTEFIETI
uniref:Fibronectin type-III domain-containing protein n=1 Tax=Mesocestoides corti TaxID=53468 RepID=A0A5K3EIK8_MESCO